MKRVKNLPVHIWPARLAAVAMALFLALFALDAFEGTEGPLTKFGHFLLHLWPTALLAVVILLAWLMARGARVPRPLWASTSTKNPAYPDTRYVDELIGPDTVNTLPDATLAAFADHGHPARTVDVGLDAAEASWAALAGLGVDVADVADRLETEGLAAFSKSFDELLGSLEAKAHGLR